MPVTELALLRLTSPNRPLSPSTKATLHQAQKAQTDFSGHHLHFLRQIEDQSLFYILGGWESIAKHNNEWIPGGTNQGLMGQLMDEVGVVWMFHLDLDPSTSNIPLDAPVIAIIRCWVESGKKGDFEKLLCSGALQTVKNTAPFTNCGGWRIDKEGEVEEFVVFSGWNTVEDHIRFVESAAFEKFGKAKDIVRGAEIRHVHVEKWE